MLLSNIKVVNSHNSNLIQTEKTNFLLVGPTGVGKTAIVKEIAKNLNIPIVITSATNYSGVGYVDSSLTEILTNLMYKTNGDLDKAEKGIIFLDEIDKICNSELKIREGILEELLTWISGTSIPIKYKGNSLTFNTSLLTFTFVGAFTNIFDNFNNQLIGFERETLNTSKKITTTTLIKGGMNKEFAGRLDTIIELNPLKDIKSLSDILIYSEISPLKSLVQYFKTFHNIHLTYKEELIIEIATRALSLSTGARALTLEVKKIKTKLLEAVTYEIIKENSTIELTPEMLDENFTFENSYKLTKTIR